MTTLHNLTPKELKKKKKFDPEGSGYDYQTALKNNMEPKNAHWSSREAKTGVLLKGKKHTTWNKLVKGEEVAGYEIYKKNGRYYSRKKK